MHFGTYNQGKTVGGFRGSIVKEVLRQRNGKTNTNLTNHYAR